MYHELYIAGIVTVLRRSSYGYLNKDGSIYFEVGFPLMYRLQVPVLEQLQCRVKKNPKLNKFWAAYHDETKQESLGMNHIQI